MVSGACIGRLLGDRWRLSSAGCAIVGAAGLSGALTHTVSTAVILTEMTEEIRYLMPCAVSPLYDVFFVILTFGTFFYSWLHSWAN